MLPNNLYKLLEDTISGEVALSTPENLEDDSAHLWHLRLVHMSERDIKELQKRRLLKNMKSYKLNFYKYLVLEKQTKVSFKVMEKENHTKQILDYIHSDVWEVSTSAPTKSHGGARFYVTFMDDYSQKNWVYFMWEKSEVFTKFKEWKAEVKNQTG